MPVSSSSPLLGVLLCLTVLGCEQQKPPAYTADFARRHHCPDGDVSTLDEGSGKKRVSGCGESELYVYECASRPPISRPEPRTPAVEPEPRSVPPTSEGETGCAWTRKRSEEPSWPPEE